MRVFLGATLLFFCIASIASAQTTGLERLGTYSRPGLERTDGVRAYLRLLGNNLESIRGTELSPRLAEFLDDSPDFSQALDEIAQERSAVGFAVFVSRMEHDVVPVVLNGGERGYSVRVYVTLVLDMFADRAAFALQNRLESVYTVAAADVSLFPEGALQRIRPTSDQIAHWYDEALWNAFHQLTDSAIRDEVLMRVRARRVFQVEPVTFSDEAMTFLSSAIIDNSGRSPNPNEERNRLAEELAYILHERISGELLRRGRNDIAILPPDAGWAVGPVGRLIADRIPVGQRLITGIESVGHSGLSICLNIARTGVIEGARNRLGSQKIAATRIEATIIRKEGDQRETRPRGISDAERVVTGRGGGRFIALRGVGDPPIYGMWREGYLDALDASVSDIVDRMIQTAEELG